MITSLQNESHMYKMNYDFEDQNLFNTNKNMPNNRLFATFTNETELDTTLKEIQNKYNILYNKIFVFEILNQDELVITYNVDLGNVNTIPPNTILVHRKKDTNTLYSLNGLNEIIKKQNNGYLDKNFSIEWNEFKNSLLLTEEGKLKTLSTKIFKIIEI